MGTISNQNTLNRTELQANINPHKTQCAYSFITNEDSKPALVPIYKLINKLLVLVYNPAEYNTLILMITIIID